MTDCNSGISIKRVDDFKAIDPPITQVINSGAEGAKIVVIGGMHGDETSPVKMIEGLMHSHEKLGVISGIVTLMIANPTAYRSEVRAVNKNLNAMLTTSGDLDRTLPESDSAAYIMSLLSSADACIDLHEHKDTGMGSLAMAPLSLRPIVTSLGIDLFVHGLETVEPGATDSYMAEIGKSGICVEVGFYKDDNTSKAQDVMNRFLSIMGVIEAVLVIPTQPLIAEAKELIIRQTENFTYAPHVKSGVILPEGIFATDGDNEYYADGNTTGVLSPRPNNPIGSSVGILISFEEVA